VIDENSPEMQRALAPYYDSVAHFNRQVADRNAEAAHAKREKEFAETTSRQREELGQVLKEREAKKQQAEADSRARNPNDAWRSASRQHVRDLQFGSEEDEEYNQQPYQSSPPLPSVPSAPTAYDPWSAPQPAQQPAQQPVQQPSPQPAAQPPTVAPRSRPPARHQRSSGNVDDDDDMSNQSWLQ
jgi:hypothetical protein